MIRHCTFFILGVFLALLVFPMDRSAAVSVSREALNRDVLTVCAAPNSLPYSNKEEEGFENKIASLIAKKLDVPLRYVWYPQTVGFFRRTIRVRECDLVLGVPVGNERIQNTNPYYFSVYVMVYRADSGIDAASIADLDMAEKKLRFGVIAGTPPVNLLVHYDLLSQATYYQRTIDTRYFSSTKEAIEDVLAGKTDIALLWGPVAGYMLRSYPALRYSPLIEDSKITRLSFQISMGTRFREPMWKQTVNTILKDLRPDINAILKSYNVPLLDRAGHLIP